MSIIVVVSVGISAVIAFLVSHATISSRLGKLEERTQSNKDRMDRLETRFDNFFLALSTLLSYPEDKIKDRIQIEVRPLIKKFDDFLNLIEKKKNPISTEQIDKLKTYRNKLVHGIPLKPEEYQDFQCLLKEISKELPEQQKGEFDWIAAALLGFVAGLIIGALIKK